jgi:hypothetical protein
MYASVSTLPEPERFTRLGAHAATAYRRLEDLARWQDDPIVRERMTTARDEARRYAEDALRLASKYKSDPAYGTVMYQANMTLAALAVREGYTDRAARFLRCASESPVSEELAYSDRIVRDWRRQVHALLQRGQRAAVVAFSDRMADINIPDRIELREAAAAIRRGEPARYYEGPAPPSEPASR